MPPEHTVFQEPLQEKIWYSKVGRPSRPSDVTETTNKDNTLLYVPTLHCHRSYEMASSSLQFSFPPNKTSYRAGVIFKFEMCQSAPRQPVLRSTDKHTSNNVVFSDRVSLRHRFEFLQNRIVHLLAHHCLLLLILPCDGFVPRPIQLNHYLTWTKSTTSRDTAIKTVPLPAEIRVWHLPDTKQDCFFHLFIYPHSKNSSKLKKNRI